MSDVSVIGLGAMGSAIAGALLDGGLEVTAWNRTAAKAEALETRGASAASSAAAAVSGSPTTIVCIDDYESTRKVLDTPDVSAVLEGRTIVQFSTGSPGEAREGEAWASRYGAIWLDGAILAYPRDLGDAAPIFVSGDTEHFERQRALLSALSSNVRYLGPAVGAAAALDLAVLSFYVGSHLGLVHGAMICESEQVSPDVMTSVIAESSASDVDEIAHMGEALTSNDYSRPSASLAVYSGILDRMLAQAGSTGLNSEIPEFANRLVKRGMAAGFGDEEILSIIKLLRRSPAA